MATFNLSSGRPLSYKVTCAPEYTESSKGLVLLSNSLCSPYGAWDRVVSVLTKRGFRVLQYNQPGHGPSGVPSDLSSNTFESMADDVRELLDHLNVKKVHTWMGVSMGAAKGIVFTAKYPGLVERLIACDTISCSPGNAGIADVFTTRVQGAREAGSMDSVVQGTLERWFGKEWLETNAAEAERMRQIMLATTIDGFATCSAALSSSTFDLRPLVEPAGKGVNKALLLVGEKDANLPQSMEELRAGIEKGLRSKSGEATAQLRVIRNAGHVCFIDGFDQFCEEVVPFLEE